MIRTQASLRALSRDFVVVLKSLTVSVKSVALEHSTAGLYLKSNTSPTTRSSYET